MANIEETPLNIQGLSLHTTAEHSKYPECYPSLNPVDIYRIHIAEKLGEVTGIEPEAIYPRLQWTNTLDKGDIVLPVSQANRTFFFFFFLTLKITLVP